MCKICCQNRMRVGREEDFGGQWFEVLLYLMKLGVCLHDSQDYLKGAPEGMGRKSGITIR